MNVVYAVVRVPFMIVAVPTSCQAPATAKATSRMSAAFAAVRGLWSHFVIAKAM